MALLRVQKVYTITINQPTMQCYDLITVHAFLSTEDCSQWCKSTPCIADNIAKSDCITASVKSLTKQQYVMDKWKHWGTWRSWIKKCMSYVWKQLLLTKTNVRVCRESTCARLSDSKESSYWWNLGTPLHAGKVAQYQNNQSIQYTHTEKIQVINLLTELWNNYFLGQYLSHPCWFPAKCNYSEC